jgi:hypothetical protein
VREWSRSMGGPRFQHLQPSVFFLRSPSHRNRIAGSPSSFTSPFASLPSLRVVPASSSLPSPRVSIPRADSSGMMAWDGGCPGLHG